MVTVRHGRDSMGILCNPAGRNTTCGRTTPLIPAVWIIPLIVSILGLRVIENVTEIPLVGFVPVVRVFGAAGYVGCNDFSGGNSEVFHLAAGPAALPARTHIGYRNPFHPFLRGDPIDCSKLAMKQTSISFAPSRRKIIARAWIPLNACSNYESANLRRVGRLCHKGTRRIAPGKKYQSSGQPASTETGTPLKIYRVHVLGV